MLLNCPDSTPTFLGLFDPGIAPHLLFYAYIPVVLVSLFFGFFVYFKSQRSPTGKLLLIIAFSFSFFILNEMMQWIAVPASLVNFGWVMAPLFQFLVWFFTIHFFYVFVENKYLSLKGNLFLSLFFLPILFFLPTVFNIKYFDLVNCEAGGIGFLWYYLYAFQIFTVIFLFIWGIIKYKKNIQRDNKNKILLFVIGVSLFLLSFSLSNILGEFLNIYEINLVGPIGMVLFILLLAYLIIRYKVFNVEIFASQGIVIAMVVLIGSQFFFINNPTNKVLNGITLFLVTIFGWWLVVSVKKEVRQRQRLEAITKELQVANIRLQELDRQKTEFLSIASHQLRTPLSILKGYIELIKDGAYGKATAKMVKVLDDMDESNEHLVKLVDEFLDITRIEQGRTKFVFQDSDMNELISGVATELSQKAEEHKLKINWKQTDKKVMINMDEEKVRHVIFNYVDNAIKYTKEGEIKIVVEEEDKGVTVRVKDTGFGFDKEDEANFFQKFYRGKNVLGTNVNGTGLGLFVCKKFIEAHNGEVWATSPGLGKGSEFGFWIPAGVKSTQATEKAVNFDSIV